MTKNFKSLKDYLVRLNRVLCFPSFSGLSADVQMAPCRSFTETSFRRLFHSMVGALKHIETRSSFYLKTKSEK